MTRARLRIWGWYAFDWATQPFHTLLLTFIFAPYFITVIGNPVEAQATWANMLAWAGIASALCAPVIGALADQSGRLIRWVAGLAILYILTCASLWFAVPGMESYWWILVAFSLGLITAELSILVTNAFLPSLGPREEIGRISGNGYAIGYAGGLLALIVTLALFAQGSDGRTFLGLTPLFGLDPDAYEGTRFVGPFCALWFAISMIPFFVWVKDPVRDAPSMALRDAVRAARQNLRTMWSRAAKRPRLLVFLGSSMFYRDALNGLYGFGGIYATGVLGWSVVQVGVFGVLGVACAGLACWLSGSLDTRYGPKPVIVACILVLLAVCIIVVGLDRTGIYGIALPEGSVAPDVVMYVAGGLIGAAGGALQSSSRSLMVRHAEVERPNEAFGLYAMTGKATSFVAPALIWLATTTTEDQRMGVSPLIVLFLIGLLLLPWVKKDGDI